MRATPAQQRLERYAFPPLLLHGDPLASALVARSSTDGHLSQHTLRTALLLNSTRVHTIVSSWFPGGGAGGRIQKHEFFAVLDALGLRLNEGDTAGDELFATALDVGDGTTTLACLMQLLGSQPSPPKPRRQLVRSKSGTAAILPPLYQPTRRPAPAPSDGRQEPLPSLSRHTLLNSSASEPLLGRHADPQTDQSQSGDSPTRDGRSSASPSPLLPAQRQARRRTQRKSAATAPTHSVWLDVKGGDGSPPLKRLELRIAIAPPAGPPSPSATEGSSPNAVRKSTSVAVGSMPPVLRPAVGPQCDSNLRSAATVAFSRAARSCVPSAHPIGAPVRKPALLGPLCAKASNRSVRLPRALRRVDGITQAELHPEETAELKRREAAAAEAKAHQEAESRPKWDFVRKASMAIGQMVNASQRDALPEREASKAEVAALLEEVSPHVEQLIDILSDWDSEYRGNGSLSKRDFRRALPLLNLSAERHVADALFDSLMPQIPDAPSDATHHAGDAAAPAAAAAAPAPASVSAAAPADARMEIWVLDRGLRWSTGSKAKRSKLFRGEGLFQDSSRSVTEQLRDALVANSLRVMDIFREWDVNGDGLITKAEFHKAIPLLGLPALPEQIDALFDEFDADGSSTITFRELNRQLRRDVKVEAKRGPEKPKEALAIADLDALRRDVRKGFLSFANTQVTLEEDPLWGTPKVQA